MTLYARFRNNKLQAIPSPKTIYVGRQGPAGAGGSSSNYAISVSIPTPTVETITLRGYSTSAGLLTALKVAKTGAGSVSVSLLVDGVAVSNFPATINTTVQNVNLNTSVNVGSIIQLVITAVSGASMLEFTLLGLNSTASNASELSISIPAPAIGSITVLGFAARAGTLTAVKNAKTASGSVAAALQVDGVNVSGFPSTINSTPQSPSISANLSLGSKVQLVISAVSAASMLELTLIIANS